MAYLANSEGDSYTTESKQRDYDYVMNSTEINDPNNSATNPNGNKMRSFFSNLFTGNKKKTKSKRKKPTGVTQVIDISQGDVDNVASNFAGVTLTETPATPREENESPLKISGGGDQPLFVKRTVSRVRSTPAPLSSSAPEHHTGLFEYLNTSPQQSPPRSPSPRSPRSMSPSPRHQSSGGRYSPRTLNSPRIQNASVSPSPSLTARGNQNPPLALANPFLSSSSPLLSQNLPTLGHSSSTPTLRPLSLPVSAIPLTPPLNHLLNNNNTNSINRRSAGYSIATHSSSTSSPSLLPINLNLNLNPNPNPNPNANANVNANNHTNNSLTTSMPSLQQHSHNTLHLSPHSTQQTANNSLSSSTPHLPLSPRSQHLPQTLSASNPSLLSTLSLPQPLSLSGPAPSPSSPSSKKPPPLVLPPTSGVSSSKKSPRWLGVFERSPRPIPVRITPRERSNSDSNLQAVSSPRSGSDLSIQWGDLKIKKMLGKGLLSHVYLAEDIRVTHKYFAVKAMSKKRFPPDMLAKFAFSERDILRRLNHPHIIRLFNTYQDPHHLYLIMEYGGGGELFTLLRRKRRFPEAWVVIYAAQMASALHYLHNMGIIYRDLKPENILLSTTGSLKLADFGFAKGIGCGINRQVAEGGYQGTGRTRTMCGTAEYMAPEIVEGKDYSFGVDWWTLGVLIYEMLAGYTPFQRPTSKPTNGAPTPAPNDHSELHKRILHDEIIFPSHFSPYACHLILGLLDRSPSKRMGCNESTGFGEEIKTHPFFRVYDWKKPPPPPYTPHIPSLAANEENVVHPNFQEFGHDSYVGKNIKKDPIVARLEAEGKEVWFDNF